MYSKPDLQMPKTATKKVFYFHGDKVDNERYYCRRCDAFVDSDHFLSPNGKHNDFEGNQFRLRMDRRFGFPSTFYRPADADRTNIAE